jgi:hypothetical protein
MQTQQKPCISPTLCPLRPSSLHAIPLNALDAALGWTCGWLGDGPTPHQGIIR